MPAYREIRADFNRDSIVVYQAYRKEITAPAVRQQRFVAPFSWGRMTWIKPSFLWLMARSNWGSKAGQECTLAVRITRAGWDQALEAGVLTSFEPQIHGNMGAWQRQFATAAVHVQWDPERTLRGKKLAHRSIQVGLSRRIIRSYTDEWILEIKDLTSTAGKIRSLSLAGKNRQARELLPPEKVYPANELVARRLGM